MPTNLDLTGFLGGANFLNLYPPSHPEITGFNDGISVASTYANEALTSADLFLQQLAALATSVEALPDITVEIGEVEKLITPITIPDDPNRPDGLDFQIPGQPLEPTLQDVAVPVLPEAPEFTAAKPELSYPATPDQLDAQVPASPDILDVNLPASPDVVLPVEPALLNIDIPAAPSLDIPTFEFIAPSAPDSPNISEFSFTEPEYVSNLLTALQTQLLGWVNGASTGLAPDVEQALFDRGRSREDMASLREGEEVRRNFASSGFPYPPGAMHLALQDAARQAADKVSAINREITIKVAELEQQNRQFAVERSVQFEGVLIERANGIANRALEAAKTTVTIAIELYQTIVARYQAELEGFKVQALVFETRLKAALAQLDIYRSELEGAKLVGELNVQSVEIYRTRISAVVALIEKYKAELSGAEITSNINRNIIGRFAEEVRAYGVQVDAKAREYDAYATQIQGEVAKVEVFSAEADAYRSQIGGYESLVNARIGEKDLEFKIKQQNPLAVYNAQVASFQSLVGAEASRVESLATVYDSDIKKYGAQIDGEVQRNRSDIEEYKMRGALLMEEARVTIQSLTANLQRLVSITGLATEISKAGGAISAQLAASAMSMLNFSHNVSQSESSGYSTSYSANESNSSSSQVGESESTTHSYSYDR